MLWVTQGCLVVLALLASIAVAGDPPQTDVVALGVNVAPSASDPNARLLIAVTDDDFLATDQPIWCESRLKEAVDACREQRSATYLRLEAVRAGVPALLRGGRAHVDGPRRVICFVCDDQRRILAVCVGVPTTRQLLGLSEDADELAVAMTLNPELAEGKTNDDVEHISPLVKFVRERTVGRVTRHYRPLVDAVMPFRSIDENANVLAEALSKDITERFLFDSPIESERWISAQQHAEARKYWCETMLAGFVGKSVDGVWPDLAASVWGAKPWLRSESVQQFATWCSESLQREGVVLQIDPSRPFLHANLITGPVDAPSKPANDSMAKREESIAQTLEAVSSRTCNLCELAVALKELGKSPVTLRNNKSRLIRWVVLEKHSAEPTLLPDGAENRLIDLTSRLKP